jgi:hypothetical protein
MTSIGWFIYCTTTTTTTTFIIITTTTTTTTTAAAAAPELWVYVYSKLLNAGVIL